MVLLICNNEITLSLPHYIPPPLKGGGIVGGSDGLRLTTPDAKTKTRFRR